MPVPRSLFGRLVLILIGGVLLAQLAGFGMGAIERAHMLRRSDGRIWAQRVADAVSLLNSMRPPERQHMVRVLSHPRLRVSLASRPLQGPTLAPTQRVREFRRQLGAVLDGAAFRYDRVHAPTGGRRLLTQVRLDDGQWVRFRFRPGPRHPPPGWPRHLLVAFGVFLLVMLIIVLLAVRWVTRPLKILAAAADALGEDMDRPPLAESGPTEVARASRAFNRMQRRLQENLADRLRLLAAVSHDLKTPLTRLRLRAELLDDEPLRDRFVRDLNEMEALSEAALDYMRDARSSEAPTDMDLSELARRVQHDWSEQGQSLRIDAPAQTPYRGRPLALRRCIDNLVSNALKYATEVALVVEDREADVTIRVLDRGRGIAPEELERVFEPFYRLERSRNRALGGSGLGLGIARNVARVHGGSLTLRNREGGGLEARLELPRRHEPANG